jgi:ribosome-associated protein
LLHQYRNNNNNNDYAASSATTKQSQRDMVDFIQRPVYSTVGDLNSNSKGSTMDPQVNDLIRCIVQAADGRKAQDIVVLNVHAVTTLCSALVILSGNSRPQNQAIAAAIASSVHDELDGMKSGGNGIPEGSAASGWMLLDYGLQCRRTMERKGW